MAEPADRPGERTAGHADAPHLHEASDVSAMGIVWFAVGLVVSMTVIALVLAWLFFVLAVREERIKRSVFPLAEEERRRERIMPPEPRLEYVEPRRPIRAEPPTEIVPPPVDPDEWLIREGRRAREAGLLQSRPEVEPPFPRGFPSNASSGRALWGGK